MRERLRQRRQVARRDEIGHQRARLCAGQHGDPAQRAVHGRFERRDRRERGLHLRGGAGGVERGAATGVEPRLHELQRARLVVRVAASDGELRLRTAQLEVVARDFRDDRQHDVVAGSHGCLRLRPRGLVLAAHAAPEVQLPARVEAGVEELVIAPERRASRHARRPARTLANVVVAGLAGDGRQEVEQPLAALRARLAQPRGGGGDVAVVVHGSVHERIQLRIAEELPPFAFDLTLRRACNQWLRAEAPVHGRSRRVVVGPDCAAGQQGGGDGDGDGDGDGEPRLIGAITHGAPRACP